MLPILERASRRDVFTKLKELQAFEKFDNQSQLQFQRNQIYKLFQYCKANVPYYKDRIRSTAFDIERLTKDIKYIQDFPCLTKAIVREQMEKIRMTNAGHVRKTGGSTGPSAFFYYDDTGMDWTSAINLMAYRMAGKWRSRTECHISAELDIKPSTRKAQIFDRIGLAGHNRKRLMIDSFSDIHLSRVLKDLKRIRPYLLQGHPSSAYALANYIEKNNLKMSALCKVFEPSGEALNKKMVQKIEQFMGCKVVNRYGNAEFGVIAHSRPQDDYRKLMVFRRAFYVEECKSAPLIVTNYTNFGFPLIRYDTGDLGSVVEENDGSYIYDIQGRIHELVKIDNDEYPTHFIMDFLDHRVKGIKEFQLIVSADKIPRLNIVPENADDGQRIITLVKARWPIGLEVEIIEYQQLKTVGWRQKFRHIIEENNDDHI